MAAITGSGITGSSVFSRIIQVLLAIYSVAVFAILAGTLGGLLPETKGLTLKCGAGLSGQPGKMPWA